MKTFNIALMGAPRMTRADAWRDRPAVLRYRGIVNDIRKEALESGYKLPDAFNVIIYMPMPKSWSGKKKEQMVLEPHQSKPDIDNLLKTVLDALKSDDQTVYDVRVTKVWGYLGHFTISPIMAVI